MQGWRPGGGERRVCPCHWGPQASAWLCWTTSSWCTCFPVALRLWRENPICRRSVCPHLSPVTPGVQTDSKGQSVGRMCPSALLHLLGGPRIGSWLPYLASVWTSIPELISLGSQRCLLSKNPSADSPGPCLSSSALTIDPLAPQPPSLGW